jgi:hypothetical protein
MPGGGTILRQRSGSPKASPQFSPCSLTTVSIVLTLTLNRVLELARVLRLVLPLASVCSFAQEDKGSIRGFVTDSTSGESVVYATVLVRDLKTGTATNTRGYYFIPAVPAGVHTLVVSSIGFLPQTAEVTVVVGEITQANFRLTPRKIELEEMVVTGEASPQEPLTNLSRRALSPRDIEALPSSVESDVLRALQTIPGVAGTSDLTARYYVRGGASDQNALLVNGATIYNPFHALGVLSVIDPETISSVEFSRGGFSPEFGGRLSSFLNVVTRDGNSLQYHGSAFASLVSGKLSMEGPVPHGSFLATARKSYSNSAFTRFLGGLRVPVEFYDVSFKTSYANPEFDPNGKISLAGFVSDDRVVNNDPLEADYTLHNNVFSASWNKVWQSPLYSTITLSYSGFNGEVFPNASQSKPRANTVVDVTLNGDFGYVYPSRDEVGFGIQNKVLSTDLSMQNLYSKNTTYSMSGWDLTAYVEYRFQRWETFGLRLGLRTKFSALSQNRPFLFEPRLKAMYRPNPLISFTLAIGWHSQEVTSLRDETEVISIFEPWIIIPNGLAAPQAAHYILGVTANLTDWCKLEIEGYYKPLIDLIDVNPAKYTEKSPDFVNVSGRATGVELSVSARQGQAFLQASYTLSSSFLDLNGIEYRPRYDSRHSVSALAGLEFGGGWECSVFWALKSGFPFTPIAGFYDRLQLDQQSPTDVIGRSFPVISWGARNSARLPVYHRLDLACSKALMLWDVKVKIGGSIMNVYDRKNLFYFDRDTGERHDMLRFSPSLFVRAEL